MAEFCSTCGQPLKMGARFCGKCGNVAEKAGAGTPNLIKENASAHVASVVPVFGWNWGAFLVPGIWLMAHRIRPNIAGAVLLGLAYGGCLIVLGINLLGWIGSIGAIHLLESATVSAAWLLGIYTAACLCSLKVAREGGFIAFENEGSPNAESFQKRQQGWAVAGWLITVAHLALVFWLASVYFPAHRKANQMPNRSAAPMAAPVFTETNKDPMADPGLTGANKEGSL